MGRFEEISTRIFGIPEKRQKHSNSTVFGVFLPKFAHSRPKQIRRCEALGAAREGQFPAVKKFGQFRIWKTKTALFGVGEGTVQPSHNL